MRARVVRPIPLTTAWGYVAVWYAHRDLRLSCGGTGVAARRGCTVLLGWAGLSGTGPRGNSAHRTDALVGLRSASIFLFTLIPLAFLSIP